LSSGIGAGIRDRPETESQVASQAGRAKVRRTTAMARSTRRRMLIAQLDAEQAAGRGSETDWVFVTQPGRPYTRSNVSERGVEKAGRRAGLGPGIRPHTLRASNEKQGPVAR
jgi:site-specific recombinase XerD